MHTVELGCQNTNRKTPHYENSHLALDCAQKWQIVEINVDTTNALFCLVTSMWQTEKIYYWRQIRFAMGYREFWNLDTLTFVSPAYLGSSIHTLALPFNDDFIFVYYTWNENKREYQLWVETREKQSGTYSERWYIYIYWE